VSLTAARSEVLREHADDGTPLVAAEPDNPASQAISGTELPVVQ
jgi:hypothetical protein